jgi:hypothetical protein
MSIPEEIVIRIPVIETLAVLVGGVGTPIAVALLRAVWRKYVAKPQPVPKPHSPQPVICTHFEPHPGGMP